MSVIKIEDLDFSDSKLFCELTAEEAFAVNGGFGFPKFIKKAASWVVHHPIEAVVDGGLIVGGAILVADGIATGNPGAVYIGAGAVATGAGVSAEATF